MMKLESGEENINEYCRCLYRTFNVERTGFVTSCRKGESAIQFELDVMRVYLTDAADK